MIINRLPILQHITVHDATRTNFNIFFFWSPSSALVELNESLFGYTTAYIITSKSHPQLLYEVEHDSQGLTCV